MWSLNVDKHHECVGEKHVFFAFDLDALSEIFSQADHETFDGIIIVLLVVCVTVWSCVKVDSSHALHVEQQV